MSAGPGTSVAPATSAAPPYDTLTSSNRLAIERFQQITRRSDDIAKDFLDAHDWDFHAAIVAYLTSTDNDGDGGHSEMTTTE